jgi:ElaB/YqjD/DUF883 family membrane-anchored ribosome-binding protein
MATNASKITGVQNAILVSDAGIDVEQIRKDATDLMDHRTESDFTQRAMNFMHAHPVAFKKAEHFIRTHPWAAKAMIGAGAIGALAPNVAADEFFGMNTSEIDGAFDLIADHIMPGAGKVISALPQLFIPIVILIVVVMILLFVPNVLTDVLDMLKGALKLKK